MRLRSVTAAAAVLGATMLAGCEPPPPRVPFTVTTTAPGADHTPGDGVCEVTPGAGDCSLPAALTEAGAVPRATVTVPAGTYAGMDLQATGDVQLNAEAVQEVRFDDVNLTVAAGAQLRADGLQTVADATGVDASFVITVAGTLDLRRSDVRSVDTATLLGTAITVQAGGALLLFDSVAIGGAHAIRNAGTLVAERAALFNIGNGRLNTEPGGASHLRATLVSRGVSTAQLTTGCIGTTPTSHGWNTGLPLGNGCGFTQPTDVGGGPHPNLSPSVGVGYGVPASYVGIDAIPVGEAGCVEGAVDLLGNPRAVDGNGDGVVACDIGAVERQPVA